MEIQMLDEQSKRPFQCRAGTGALSIPEESETTDKRKELP